MFPHMIGYSIIFILLFPLNIFSMKLETTTTTTTCDLLKLPRECLCQRTRHFTIDSLNETRLRCRKLTEITTNHHWSQVLYNRLIFETSNDNLTLHSYVFADIIARTLRFHVQNLFLQDHTFNNAYIGQLSISNHETYGRIHFQSNSQIFSGTTITNLHFQSIDFQNPISELIFSNTKIYLFVIQASKFYGFLNQKLQIMSKPITKIQYDHFLEYESLNPTNPKKIQSNNENDLIYLTIYTIISSINTTNLTENYFPNNLEYNQLEEIELSYNRIDFLNANVFRYLKRFQGRLILKNNQIKSLDLCAFDHLFFVKNFSLTKNFIRYFSSRHFRDLQQVEELDLSFNQINQLHNQTFEYLANLQILYLNYNPLEFIHAETFANLTKLKQIHFQGVQFIHLVDQLYFQWIWNLASLHMIHLLQNDFELSDVAFCILSRYNETIFHLSRQYSCSCNIHYFNLNQNFVENPSISPSKYQTNYLRLTPICHENHTESISHEQIAENDLILRDLENKCDYKLLFLDCDAMTTTARVPTITTLSQIETTSTVHSDLFAPSTTKTPITSSTTKWTNAPPKPKRPLQNIKKLFTVLATLIAITIGAVILVFCWFRFQKMLKRKKKKKTFVEQQQHFNSPATNNHQSTVPHYASSDMSGSIYSAQISTSKSQSEALIEPGTSTIEKLLHDQNSLDKQPIEMQTVTQC